MFDRNSIPTRKPLEFKKRMPHVERTPVDIARI